MAVNRSADGTDVESRTRPRSNNSQGPIIDTSGAGPQDTSDSSVYKDEDDNASLARGAQSHHSQRRADPQPASASARSSSDLEVIKADLTELLASFRPASTRAPSPRSRERSRTRSQAEAMTLSARPEPDSEETSPREINASRKSSVVSMHSFTSASSSSSAHFRTTGGYKARHTLPLAQGRLDSDDFHNRHTSSFAKSDLLPVVPLRPRAGHPCPHRRRRSRSRPTRMPTRMSFSTLVSILRLSPNHDRRGASAPRKPRVNMDVRPAPLRWRQRVQRGQAEERTCHVGRRGQASQRRGQLPSKALQDRIATPPNRSRVLSDRRSLCRRPLRPLHLFDKPSSSR